MNIILQILRINWIKSLYLNFRQFGMRGLKMPILLEYGVQYYNKGKIVSCNLRPKMLIIKSGSGIHMQKGSNLIIKGCNSIFNSRSKIIIGENGIMEIGNRFSANGGGGFQLSQTHCVWK